MQWDQNTQFSEQQEEEDKREEFWVELHYGRGGRTAFYGSKLEVELDCPGGPNKAYWGRRSGRLRTRNWGYTQHIDAVWSMKCFKELIKLDVFPDAKDISESMGALRAATLYSHLSLRKDAQKNRRRCVEIKMERRKRLVYMYWGWFDAEDCYINFFSDRVEFVFHRPWVEERIRW